MADTKWTIKGREFVNCNCSYGCPCQFNGLPTHGHCQAVGGFEIEQGHHGSTKLDGLKFVGIFRWPGAIHEGKGEAAVVIDERATEPQRAALLRIHVRKTARSDLRSHRVSGRRRRAKGSPGRARRDRRPWRTDPQSSDRGATPRAHRHGRRFRIHACRNRTRLDQDVAADPAGACRLLRPIRRDSSLPKRHRALSRHV